jgi:hypothetical protein
MEKEQFILQRAMTFAGLQERWPLSQLTQLFLYLVILVWRKIERNIGYIINSNTVMLLILA